MTRKDVNPVPLVRRLIELKERNDRGALAALRSGLGKPPGAAPRMLPYVAPFLSRDDGPATEAAFLTAALFARHPQHADMGTLGESLRLATRSDANPNGKHGLEGVERRFAAALDADPQDLARHLDGLVSLCESAGVAINWHRFYRDLCTLLGQNETQQIRVRTRWAREFWGGEGHVDESGQTVISGISEEESEQ